MTTVTFDTQRNELQNKAAACYKQAMDLLVKEGCSAEDMEQADRLTKEAEDLNARVSKLTKLNLQASDTIRDQQQTAANPQGAAADFKSFGEFMGAYRTALVTKGKTFDPRLQPYVEKDLAGTSGASGGYLIPTQALTEIMSIAAPMSIVRPKATIIQMTGRDVEYPQADQTGTGVGRAQFFGGIRTFWMAEGSAITASEPKFRQGKLTAHELVGMTLVNNSMLDDAPALSAFMGSALGFPGAIAWEEDNAFLSGTGVGQPLGVINAPGTKVVARNTALTIKYDDLAKMTAGFMGDRGVWVASIAAKETLLLMNGPTGNAFYLWGDATRGLPDTLLGRPIYFTDKLPAVGTRGDIGLYDFSYYLVGNREQGTTVNSDASQYFGSNKTVFRIVHRVDGQPWLAAPITLKDNTTTISPFVTLAT